MCYIEFAAQLTITQLRGSEEAAKNSSLVIQGRKETYFLSKIIIWGEKKEEGFIS